MKYYLPFLLFIMTLFLVQPIMAQVTGENAEERMELSRKFHELRPVQPQVERAIARVAERLASNRERAIFENTIRRILNIQAIERFSIEAMAELMTKEELEVMVEYYSKPEAISAAEKLPQYQEKLVPEIMKMLDRAMMEMRTGAAGG